MSASKRHSHWGFGHDSPSKALRFRHTFSNSACLGDKKSARAASPAGRWEIEVSLSDIET